MPSTRALRTACVTSALAHRRGRRAHRGRVGRRRRVGVVGDQRRQPGGDRQRLDHVAVVADRRHRRPRRPQHVRVARQQHRAVGAVGAQRLDEVAGGRVHRLPAEHHPPRAEALGDARGCPRPAARSRHRWRGARAPPPEAAGVRSTIWPCMSAISTAAMPPIAVAQRQRPARVVGVHVHLRRLGVADHDQRVTERGQGRLQRGRVDARGRTPRSSCSSGTPTAPRGGRPGPPARRTAAAAGASS